jgi:hypothetical protein
MFGSAYQQLRISHGGGLTAQSGYPATIGAHRSLHRLFQARLDAAKAGGAAAMKPQA